MNDFDMFAVAWCRTGWTLLLVFTAGLTAYYTFRVFFRVFMGPAHFEPGDEVHGHGGGGDDHGHGHGEPMPAQSSGHATHEDATHEHFHPHAPG